VRRRVLRSESRKDGNYWKERIEGEQAAGGRLAYEPIEANRGGAKAEKETITTPPLDKTSTKSTPSEKKSGLVKIKRKTETGKGEEVKDELKIVHSTDHGRLRRV